MAQQDHQNLFAVHDLDFDNLTHYLANTLGNGVISGLAVTERGAGANMSVDVAAGDARADGTLRNFASVTNVVISTSDPSNPRKDLVVINSAGSIVILAGTPEAATPSGQVRRFTLTPSPADLTDGDMILAEMWVGAGVTSILNADISSRSIDAIFGDKEMFWPAFPSGGATRSQNQLWDGVLIDASGEDALMGGLTPDDFSSLIEAVVLIIPGATDTAWDADIFTRAAAVGENRTTHTAFDTTTTYNITLDILFEMDVSGLLTFLNAGDYFTVSIEQKETTSVIVHGLRIKYR